MARFRRSSAKLRDRTGITAVMMAILLTVLIGFAALAVDVGYIMVTRNELQNIADAAALAGARWLGNEYQGMTYEHQMAYVCDPSAIQTVVQQVAAQSFAGSLEGLTVNPGDIRIGDWNQNATPPLTETLNAPDAVSVTVRRDGAANGPITTFFARVFGVDTVDLSADATAAL